MAGRGKPHTWERKMAPPRGGRLLEWTHAQVWTCGGRSYACTTLGGVDTAPKDLAGQPALEQLPTMISYLPPSSTLCQVLGLLTILSVGFLGTAIPAGAAGEKQGLCPQAVHSSAPCVPGCHPTPALLPRHLLLGPQQRESAAVGASHLAWLASGEGRYLAEKPRWRGG
jgi:hypothetical protein